MSQHSQNIPLSLRDAAYGVLVAAIAAIALIGALSVLAALAPAAAANRVPLKLERAAPDPSFVAGKEKAGFRYEIGGQKERDLVIEAVRRKDRNVVSRWRKDGIAPGEKQTIRWNGSWGGRKGAAPNGKYVFRVKERGGKLADRSDARGNRSLKLRGHRFPVPGRHSYGDAFGAGRGHQGQDIFARCGARLLAARAGRVQFVGRGGSAGNYVVIDGRGTNVDYVYMHLEGKPTVREGERVKTGQRIGFVGQSGNARGCHLHFELWSGPGWYEGGSPMRNVDKHMRRWDRHS